MQCKKNWLTQKLGKKNTGSPHSLLLHLINLLKLNKSTYSFPMLALGIILTQYFHFVLHIDLAYVLYQMLFLKLSSPFIWDHSGAKVGFSVLSRDNASM